MLGAVFGKVIEISGFRHSDDRVQQQQPANLFDGALGHVFMCPVQRVPRLKGDDVFEVTSFETAASLRGGKTQFAKVKMNRRPQDLQPARNVLPAPLVHLRDERMAVIIGSENFARRGGKVPLVNFFNRRRRDNFMARID